MKLAVIVPSQDMVYVPFLMSMLALQNTLILTPPVKEEFDLNIMTEQNSLLVSGRQHLVEKALEWGATHILKLDSDMVFPPDIVHRLLKHDKPVVACNYVKRRLPATPVTRDFGVPERDIPTKRDSSGLQKVKFTGFGVVLIKAEVFKKIPEPWFDTIWQFPPEGGHPYIVGEDVFFFEALRHFAKEDVYIDHDASKLIEHIGIFQYHNYLAEINEEVVSGSTDGA